MLLEPAQKSMPQSCTPCVAKKEIAADLVHTGAILITLSILGVIVASSVQYISKHNKPT